ncbi:hypothetical protein ACFLYF_00145 [Chloroflexota bacterium]
MQKRILYLFLVVALVVMMIPTFVSAAEPVQVTNFGFIPNSGEASVSKVNLINGDVVARYYTAPRLGGGNVVPPYAWRTSRIAQDTDGDAYVLNVGSDAYLTAYPNDPGDFNNYEGYVPGNGLVGSVVHIVGDVEAEGLNPGVDTSDDHANPMDFGDDDAVQVFEVGAQGAMPRAIAIEPDGDVWIGFYGGQYFQKYTYDGSSFDDEGGPVSGDFSPYEAKIDKNGILWFTSRDSNPSIGAVDGIYYFDTAAVSPVVNHIPLAHPYALLIDNGAELDDVVVWVTAFDGNLHQIVDDGSPAVDDTIAITGATQLRGMGFDGIGNIWIANTNHDTVCWYNPAGGTSGESDSIMSGASPVGVGGDAAGNMWVVCRYDGNDPGFIAKFDPVAVISGPDVFTNVYIGYRPYAYGNFVNTANIGIDIEKSVSVDGGITYHDADSAPGPTADEGITVYFMYEVTNTGELPLANVVVKDDNATPGDDSDDFYPTPVDVSPADGFNDGDVNEDSILDLDETWLYMASETAVGGTNIADVIGWYPDDSGISVTDEDPANYIVEEDFEGCTPGFWKNNADKHEASAWPEAYDPNQSFSSVFGREITVRVGGKKVPPVTDPSLLVALGANGGGINALARASVAALLNAAADTINYQIATPAEVITMVQAAIDENNGELIDKDLAGELDGYNNAGCVVNQQGEATEID